MGDVILTTALIEKIRQQDPSIRIDFLVRRGSESLLTAHPYIHTLWVWDKKKKYRSLIRLLKKIRAERYDLIVNVQRHFTTALFMLLARAKKTCGFRASWLSIFFSRAVVYPRTQVHELARNQNLIADFTDDKPAAPRLYPSAKDHELAAPYLATSLPFITLSPSSAWHTKIYPVEKWVAFLSFIQHACMVYILGGKSDSALAEKIITETKNINIQMQNLCGKLPLLPSAVLMQKALVNYALDSSPTHIASAMDAPICTIFCSTSPVFGFAPCSHISYSVTATPAPACYPCTNHGRKKCPEKHFRCAWDIRLSQLSEPLAQAFARMEKK